MNSHQKIISVRREEDLSPHLDEYTSTWTVVRVLGERDGMIDVLLERDEVDSARKQQWHDDYLDVVSRIKL